MQKKRRPKVSLPGPVKVAAMLSPRKDGKVDREYLRLMCDAVYAYEKHRNNSLRQMTKDSTSVD